MKLQKEFWNLFIGTPVWTVWIASNSESGCQAYVLVSNQAPNNKKVKEII